MAACLNATCAAPIPVHHTVSVWRASGTTSVWRTSRTVSVWRASGTTSVWRTSRTTHSYNSVTVPPAAVIFSIAAAEKAWAVT